MAPRNLTPSSYMNNGERALHALGYAPDNYTSASPSDRLGVLNQFFSYASQQPLTYDHSSLGSLLQQHAAQFPPSMEQPRLTPRTETMRVKLIAPIPPGEVNDPDGGATDGSDVLTIVPLPSSGSIFCGRDHKSCDLWIADIHCSRKQAEIVIDDKRGKVSIIRFGSNPTKVHRGDEHIVLHRFESFELHDGDTIIFPKEHAYQVCIEKDIEYFVGR